MVSGKIKAKSQLEKVIAFRRSVGEQVVRQVPASRGTQLVERPSWGDDRKPLVLDQPAPYILGEAGQTPTSPNVGNEPPTPATQHPATKKIVDHQDDDGEAGVVVKAGPADPDPNTSDGKVKALGQKLREGLPSAPPEGPNTTDPQQQALGKTRTRFVATEDDEDDEDDEEDDEKAAKKKMVN